MDFLASFAPYYFFVYWFLVLLLTVNYFSLLNRCQGYSVINRPFDYKPLIIFSIFFILFFGLRPLIYGNGLFGDTMNYHRTYTLIQDFGVFNMRGDTEASKDPLFYALMYSCAQIMDPHLFFTICLFLYVVLMFAGCRKIDPQHGALLMLSCYGAFEFYPFAVNGIRNGIACSCAIMALACLCKKEKLLAIALSFAAIGFHKSTILPIITMFFTYYVSKPKYMYIAWAIAILVSLTIGGYIDNVLSMTSYDQRLAYNLQNNDADGVVLEHRFRWDFLLFSSMPLLLGWYTIFKRKYCNKTYLLLLGTYIYANCFWVLAIRAIFSNRIAYLSWFLYPIVLAYPLLNFPVFKKQHSKKTAWILLAHFGFTTFFWLL
jgi:hypothetical protein